MKNTIQGFNQRDLIELGLDNDDALILRWFVDFKDAGKMVSKIIENEKYYWIKYSQLIEDLPILKAKTKDSIYRRLKKMTKAGILLHKTIKEDGTFSFYCLGENYIKLITDNNEKPCRDKSEGYGKKSVGGTEINPEQKTNLLKNIKKESKKEQKAEEKSAYKGKKSNKETYEDIINTYTKDVGLKDTLIEFIKMRKCIKSPMTNRALRLLLKKLDFLTSKTDIKIEILNESIINNWKSVYALKENSSQEQVEDPFKGMMFV